MSITLAHCLRNFRPSKKKKIWIRFDFLRFRIRCMHFDRKGWRIRKNGKTHAKISDSVCNGLNSKFLKEVCLVACFFSAVLKFVWHFSLSESCHLQCTYSLRVKGAWFRMADFEDTALADSTSTLAELRGWQRTSVT